MQKEPRRFRARFENKALVAAAGKLPEACLAETTRAACQVANLKTVANDHCFVFSHFITHISREHDLRTYILNDPLTSEKETPFSF